MTVRIQKANLKKKLYNQDILYCKQIYNSRVIKLSSGTMYSILIEAP